MWWMALALAADCTKVDSPVFVEEVVSFAVGGGVEPDYAVATNALGAPDFHEGAGAVSLGNRMKNAAELIVLFRSAVLYDGPGADLVIWEQGPSAEATELAVSVDGVKWVEVGRVEGAVREVDLKGRVPAGAHYSMVRLRTGSKRTAAGPWAGPDIDAVEARNACVLQRANS